MSDVRAIGNKEPDRSPGAAQGPASGAPRRLPARTAPRPVSVARAPGGGEPADARDGFAGEEADAVVELLGESLAANTRLAYRAGWERFAAYCEARGQDPMKTTPADVANFLVRLASRPRSPKATTRPGEALAAASLRLCLAAINWKFRESGIDSPASHPRVAAVLRALRRRSDGPGRRVKALREHDVVRILEHCDARAGAKPYRPIAVRDAAIVAVGFAAALRRSEICGLRVEDVEFVGSGGRPVRRRAGPGAGGDAGAPGSRRAGAEEGERVGMRLLIRASKTDQYRQGQRIAVPEGESIRPVRRLRRWLALSGIDRGPAFQTMRRGGRLQGRPLSHSDVPRLVKRYVSAIGLDPADYSAHSLRAGFVTSAAAHHARLDKIMEVTRHKSTDMVLRYIRRADAFEDHAGAGFL